MAYEVRPAYTTLADTLRQNVKERSGRVWDESVRLAVEHVGGLTAVDGATVVTANRHVVVSRRRRIRNPFRCVFEKRTEPSVTNLKARRGIRALRRPRRVIGARHL